MRNFVYHLHDGASAEAMLVDPGFDAARILRLASGAAAPVTHVFVTHGHPDHVGALAEVCRATGARVLAHRSSDVPGVDHALDDGDEVQVGALRVKAVHTPGHRFDSVCYLVGDGQGAPTHVLTGDTLFVGECGRTDLPGSDVRAMHRSLLSTLRALPDDLIVLPGHDYGPTPTSTLGAQKRTNYTMQPRTLDEFVAFMATP